MDEDKILQSLRIIDQEIAKLTDNDAFLVWLETAETREEVRIAQRLFHNLRGGRAITVAAAEVD